MRASGIVLLGPLGLAASCAAESQPESMKVNERCTIGEFRRDHAECSRGAKLHVACRRSRRWVDVIQPAEKPPEFSDRPRRT